MSDRKSAMRSKNKIQKMRKSLTVSSSISIFPAVFKKFLLLSESFVFLLLSRSHFSSPCLSRNSFVPPVKGITFPVRMALSVSSNASMVSLFGSSVIPLDSPCKYACTFASIESPIFFLLHILRMRIKRGLPQNAQGGKIEGFSAVEYIRHFLFVFCRTYSTNCHIIIIC